jgi:anti-sigma factor RsiW
MFLPYASGPDKTQLTRYLLADSGEEFEEFEEIEELAIADSEIAWRVRDVENDLVDAYVRGTLDADTRTRFESFYLSSPRRRAKVQFARAFVRTIDTAVVPEPEPATIAPPWYDRLRPRPRSWLAWSLTFARELRFSKRATIAPHVKTRWVFQLRSTSSPTPASCCSTRGTARRTRVPSFVGQRSMRSTG